jgi:hypothetical protein
MESKIKLLDQMRAVLRLKHRRVPGQKKPTSTGSNALSCFMTSAIPRSLVP